MTQPVMKRVKVSKHKRSLSKRSSQGSIDLNYKTLEVVKFRFPKRVYDSATKSYVIKYEEKDLFPYSKTQFGEIATGSRKVDKTNPWFIFKPRVKDFRPFLWQRPKPYFREQWITIGYPPVAVEAIKLTSEEFKLSDFTFEGGHIRNSITGFVRTTPTYSARQIHYLNFNSKLANQKVDVLTSIAEGKSTISMLGNAAKDMFDFYRAVKKADIKTIKRIFSRKGIKRSLSKGWRNKTAESRWLELQYGWSPLIGDLKIILEEIVSEEQIKAPLIKVNHSTLLKPSDHYDPELLPNVNFFGILKTSCYYTVNSEGMKQAAQWNLGNNPLLTGWELVPYSFVIDWFIPIGDFLAQFSSSQGMQFVSGTTVSHIRARGEHTKSGVELLQGQQLRIEYSSRFHGFTTERIVHVTSPIGFPVFQGGLNVKRALNALALILILRK